MASTDGFTLWFPLQPGDVIPKPGGSVMVKLGCGQELKGKIGYPQTETRRGGVGILIPVSISGWPCEANFSEAT